MKKEKLLSAKLKSGPFRLSRVGDGAGDVGSLLRSISPVEMQAIGGNGEIIVGCHIQCGSPYARTYQNQDFWITTPVAEIVSATDTEIVFKTRNSEYVAEYANK